MFVAFSEGIDFNNESAQLPAEAAMILDPCGRILAQGTCDSRKIVSADLDSALIDQSIGRQWLMRRRPSLYAPLAHTSGQASIIADAPRVARAGSVALSFAVVGRDRLLR
jgi:hypothetical protein